MFRENLNTTNAIIDLIKTLPLDEQTKIKQELINAQPLMAPATSDTREYAKRLMKFNTFVKKHRVTLPKGFKFDREKAHERI